MSQKYEENGNKKRKQKNPLPAWMVYLNGFQFVLFRSLESRGDPWSFFRSSLQEGTIREHKREARQVRFQIPQIYYNQDISAFISSYIEFLGNKYYLNKRIYGLGILITDSFDSSFKNHIIFGSINVLKIITTEYCRSIVKLMEKYFCLEVK